MVELAKQQLCFGHVSLAIHLLIIPLKAKIIHPRLSLLADTIVNA